MKQTTITDAKNGLSALIDTVRAGESVLITDRGVPVAVIGPVSGDPDPGGRLARLERCGLVQRGSGLTPVALLRSPGPRPHAGASAVDVLLDERASGR